ncbi:MAG: peptidase domain protein [Pseudarthrobacter sp.]|nr:peptidase domain protein [Pseudarthrobacter sp.]
MTRRLERHKIGQLRARTLSGLLSKGWLCAIGLTVVASCVVWLPLVPGDATAGTTHEGKIGVEAAVPPVVADAAGFLYFDRVDVETIGADGTRRMRVASHGLTRPAAGKLVAPLEVLTLSSRYGPRISPLTGALGEFHWGQDFSSPCGTRVYSADSGVARAVGWHPWGGGNRVEIDHGNGIITTYNHLESTAVEQGESVKVGEVIAHVGTTGSSTGCHLHFETLVKGIHTDPSNWDLLPISQLDQLDDLPRNRFDPSLGSKTDRPIVWAIPANRPANREISGGDLEAPAVKPPVSTDREPSTPPPSDSGSPSTTPSTSPTGSSGSSTPTTGQTDPSPTSTQPTTGPVTTTPSSSNPPITSDPPVTSSVPVTTDPPVTTSPAVTTDPPVVTTNPVDSAVTTTPQPTTPAVPAVESSTPTP